MKPMARRTPHYGDFGIVLDRNSGIPLHQQLCAALRKSIAEGIICKGTRLPSSRALGALLEVSRNTVLAAYDELLAEGMLYSRRGSGTSIGNSANGSKDVIVNARTPREWHMGAALPGRRLEWAEILFASQYPLRRARFCDPDGNGLYLYDSRAQA
ncbi:MAG TPA: winged helix-turn-helix domain-containing protein [Candidatus Limnocylindrales bacterium]|nr:winged helix-turn-helix domain-containing protein [Candidatus Limnocylindrales bacterium]